MITYPIPGIPYVINDDLEVYRIGSNRPVKVRYDGLVTLNSCKFFGKPEHILAFARDGIPLEESRRRVRESNAQLTAERRVIAARRDLERKRAQREQARAAKPHRPGSYPIRDTKYRIMDDLT